MESQLSLTTDGIEMVSYPRNMQISVAHAAEAWEDFLQLPHYIKEQFAATELQSGIGYEKKGNGERESNDIKENFDITHNGLAQLLRIPATTETATNFLTATSSLFENLEAMILEYGQHVEATYNIPGFANEAAKSRTSAFVRFLKYPPVPQDTVIGEPHVDHSGFTFHLYESTDGCEHLSLDKKLWLPMPIAPDQAAAFASMQTQYFSNNELRGLCHRIIANHTTSQIGRTAMVAFVPLVNAPIYDRGTHGRLQEMSPGFNYDMRTQEFRQYF